MDLLFAGGDVAGPLTLAFCLPNDETVRRDHGIIYRPLDTRSI